MSLLGQEIITRTAHPAGRRMVVSVWLPVKGNNTYDIITDKKSTDLLEARDQQGRRCLPEGTW